MFKKTEGWYTDKMQMKQMFEENRICAIIRNIPEEKLADCAAAIYAGGVRIFEVAMNTPRAAFQIELLKTHLGADAKIGAGTVTTKERCREAMDAGAEFFLTPSVIIPTMEFCRRYDIPLLPGVMTPTDVSLCLSYGYSVLKLFPANAATENYIQNLKGPFPETDYVAVGGVSKANIARLMSQGYIGAGIGSGLVSNTHLQNDSWDSVTKDTCQLIRLASLTPDRKE